MIPESNQPAKLYATAKTHKFDNLKDINSNNLKFRPIIDQTGTFTYNASKVIADYLKPLSNNKYTIQDTQQFPEMITSLPSLLNDEEYVSYDVDSLFTNVPFTDTIDYILHQIYHEKKLKPICSKTVFKRILLKLTTDCTFTLNGKFYKQTDGCSMGGPLSVIISNIWLNKAESDVVTPQAPEFYKRYVDDIFTKRKKNVPDVLFQNLNSHHPNIKLTIEQNPSKFLDTKLTVTRDKVITSVNRKSTKLPIHWSSSVPKRYKRNMIKG